MWCKYLPSVFSRVTVVLLLAFAPLACSGGRQSDGDGKKDMPESDKTIEQVLSEHTDEWMSIPGVTGTGLGKCGEELCIRVFVTRELDGVREKIPQRIDGYIVEVVLTGSFHARD